MVHQIEVRIVEGVENTAPKEDGSFLRITRAREYDDDFFVVFTDFWDCERCSIVGGQLMPQTNEDKLEKISNDRLFEVMRQGHETVVFMTEETAKILLPEMVRPRVPFKIRADNFPKEIRLSCHRSLGFLDGLFAAGETSSLLRDIRGVLDDIE